jgi:catechol 2,3-dioxygenase-like lactoylglutathione lyase family enzyme
MSERLLKTLRKFADFQAEYEGSIPFTRSKAISMASREFFNLILTIILTTSLNTVPIFASVFSPANLDVAVVPAISSMHQPLLLFRFLSCAITTALSACSSVFTEARVRIEPEASSCENRGMSGYGMAACSGAKRTFAKIATSPKCCQLRASRNLAGKLNRRALSMIEGISAVTLGTHEMPRAVRFYRALGFEVLHGGDESSFTSFRAGTSYLNLIAQPAGRRWSWWGRVIFYVADVDALYDRALAAGYQPATVPCDAEWGERFFHLIDPDGHELSFARPLLPVSVR